MQHSTREICLGKIWKAFSVIFFPIACLRLVYHSLQTLAGAVIHPAALLSSRIVSSRELDIWRERLKNEGGQELSIGTPDGETLNAMLFSAKGKSRGAIINTFGNCAYYERAGRDFVDFVRYYVGKDIDILVLNTRGCGKSTGLTSPEGMGLDVYRAGEYLWKKKNVVPLFSGHSLGGYAAVKGAGLFQKQHPELKISAVNNRSFTSLSEVAHKMFNQMAARLVRCLDWELDARKEWRMLKGHKIVIHHKDDFLDPPFISYASKQKKNLHSIEMERLPGEDPHNRDFTDQEARRIGKRIYSALVASQQIRIA